MGEVNTRHDTKRGTSRLILRLFLLGLFVIGLFFALTTAYILSLNAAPANTYPIEFSIESGDTAMQIAAKLQRENVVQSEVLLYLALVLFHDPTEIKASEYIIDRPFTTIEIANRLIEGDFDSNLVRFTHIEGDSVRKLSENAASLPNVREDEFLVLATPLEGRLFPDTYFVRNDFTTTELVDTLHSTFLTFIADYEASIATTPYTLNEVLILASIIEREANTPESMQLVASVFNNRLEIGMPLQADASIEYILDKPLSELTAADLDIDSPYNTYTNPGLPPTPIGNPGRVSIEAVLDPAESDYFYYITDPSGTFHFAETYAEHLRNIDVYLR